jgi:hypothetical protein
MPNRGIKNWVTGDVLYAADLNEYVMQQAVMVFDSVSDRNTSLASSLSEGMAAYCKDVQKLFVYNGTAWDEYGTKAEILAQENRTGQVLLYMEVL